jgi:hypothetical protein
MQNCFYARRRAGADIEDFIVRGHVRLDNAFRRSLAEEMRTILWRDTGCDQEDASTWTLPVIRLGDYAGGPFMQAVNTPALHRAFDQLVGNGRWLARGSLGTFPIRFPSEADPGDTGWHIVASFSAQDPDFLNWRANIFSRGRALLMLFPCSDVGPDDAPTRIRAGSHLAVARRLAPAGEAGLTLGELAADNFAETADLPEIVATGPAGTVYLCHPFLVHGAQPHRGKTPRFLAQRPLAQPPLLPATPLMLKRADGDHSAIELAIRNAFT